LDFASSWWEVMSFVICLSQKKTITDLVPNNNNKVGAIQCNLKLAEPNKTTT